MMVTGDAGDTCFCKLSRVGGRAGRNVLRPFPPVRMRDFWELACHQRHPSPMIYFFLLLQKKVGEKVGGFKLFSYLCKELYKRIKRISI